MFIKTNNQKLKSTALPLRGRDRVEVQMGYCLIIFFKTYLPIAHHTSSRKL